MTSRLCHFAPGTFRTAMAAWALLLAFASSSAAQVAIPTAASEASPVLNPEIAKSLAHGQELEQGRRWGEAVLHYEDSLRLFPKHPELERKLTLARVHFDVTRRYADSTYVAELTQLTERAALDLYGEVLNKVQQNYVHAPDWPELLRRGALHLEVALSDPVFLDKHALQIQPQRLDAFFREQFRLLDLANVRSPQTARDAVGRVARAAWQHLGLSPTAVVMEFVCGATCALDQYSTYLTRGQLDEVYSQIEGNFVGLGVELKSSEGSLLIVTVIPNSPAERAGIRAGDRIVAVDGIATKDVSTDKAADLLKGEEGSIADVSVISPGMPERRLRIKRERVEVPSIEGAKLLDAASGVAYLRMTSFQKNTVRDLDAALWNLHRQGMRSLIIDLRGNPGGLLTAAVEVADRFLEQGTIVSTRGRSTREDFDYRAHPQGTWRVPLVVIVDRDSASASEIFAGAIHDLRRGTIVGERSYGKGSVQGIFPLTASRSGVRLTTAKFYSPSGQAISNHGVEPDVAVRFASKPTADAPAADRAARDEAFLSAAVQAARSLMAAR